MIKQDGEFAFLSPTQKWVYTEAIRAVNITYMHTL